MHHASFPGTRVRKISSRIPISAVTPQKMNRRQQPLQPILRIYYIYRASDSSYRCRGGTLLFLCSCFLHCYTVQRQPKIWADGSSMRPYIVCSNRKHYAISETNIIHVALCIYPLRPFISDSRHLRHNIKFSRLSLSAVERKGGS